MVEVADEGDLLEDVGLDARNAVEEEEGEDAGGDTEGGADGAPVRARCQWVFPGRVCSSSDFWLVFTKAYMRRIAPGVR